MTTATTESPLLLGAAAPPDGSGPTRPLAGTGWMLRLVLRRDRIRLVLWVAAIVGLVLISASSVEGLYNTPESLANYAALVDDNAAIIVQSGPGYGLDDPTTGAVLMNELSIWSIIIVALMSTLMMTRHTRAEEETERAELLRSAPVGRYAPAAAALIGVLLANIAVAVSVMVGLALVGFDASGSAAFGATLVGAGMVFAAVALVTAQVASTSRAANGLAIIVLGLSFVLRAVGDVGDNGLSWLSPIGWAQAIRAFADERWSVLGLPLVTGALLVGGAAALAAHRDFGAGLLAQRAGPIEAGTRLGSSLGLAARLHRASILGWAAGVAVLGFFYGVVANEAERMVEDNPEIADFFARLGQGSITDAFLATSVLMIGLLTTGFTVAAVLRLRAEETSGRADPILVTPTTRWTWASSHLVMAALGTVGVMLAGGVSSGLGAAVTMDDPGLIAELGAAALVMTPAVLLLGAVTFAISGAAPRWSLFAWAGVAFVAIVGLLGEVLDLPGWVRDVSPFEHVPALPAASFSATPLVVLCLVAAALLTLGVVGLRRRDINAT